MKDWLQRIRIVLVRPLHAGNVGAVARVMANMELGELWLVAPRADHRSLEARQRSTQGERYLDAVRVVDELPQALQGVNYSVASSCRGGMYREQIEVTPGRMASLVREKAVSGGVALVLGPEDTGLRSDEVLCCDAVVRIPTSPAYSSLNLSHATAICAYELYRLATEAEGDAGKFLGAGEGVPATAETLHQLMSKLESALMRIGYLRPQHPEHLLFPIRAILSRAALSQTEAQILIGLAHQIHTFANRHDPQSNAPQTP